MVSKNEDGNLSFVQPQVAPAQVTDPNALLAESDAFAALMGGDPVLGAIASVVNATAANRQGETVREVIADEQIKAAGMAGMVTGSGPRHVFLWRRDTGRKLRVPMEQARRLMFAPVISWLPIDVKAYPGIECEECAMDEECRDPMVRVDYRVAKSVQKALDDGKSERAQRIIENGWAVHMWGFHRSQVWIHIDEKLASTVRFLENLQRTPGAQP
jgi:hypothetical protein